jgi:small GTP-binding protein
MDKLKICMIGATAVGKTSLVARFVHSIFRERYETTIGVRIQTREICHAGHTLNLVLWDLSGEDEFQNVQPAYLRGAAGYLVVIDGTRVETVEAAITLHERARAAIDETPFVVLLNKADLVASWALDARVRTRLERLGWQVFETSAKTGIGVDEAFHRLLDQIVVRWGSSWT